MKRISSAGTFWIKKVFPAFWFGVVAMSVGVGVFASDGHFSFLVVPLLMAVIGYFLFRKLLWDLADVVDDAGDALLVRRGSLEQRIPLREVMNVSMSQFTNPPRLSLRLRHPGPFGDEVVFVPPWRFASPFARDPVAEDLIRRVDSARGPP